MTTILRPTFELVTPLSPDEAARRLEALYSAPGAPYEGQSVHTHLTITFAREHRGFWSPWLHLDLHPHEHDATRLFARFSPAPSIWTGFMLAYMALATIILICACWAFSQYLLDQPPTLLWGVVLPGAIAAAMLIAARIGQSMAREEMAALHDAVTRALTASPEPPAR